MSDPRWRRYLRFWRRDGSADVDDELRFHFSRRVAEYEASGLSREDAVAAARERFGDVGSVRDDLVRIDSRIARRSRIAETLDAARLDLRYVLRGLRRRPGVAATVSITLAVAVGANGALFSLLDPLLFRPPAGVADPSSLRRVYTARPQMEANFRVGSRFSYPEYRSLKNALAGDVSVAVDEPHDSVEVSAPGIVLTTGVEYTTADYLPMLGVRLERGRSFSTAEDDPSSPANVAVIGHVLAEQIGGIDAALGQKLRVRGKAYVVIGVTADGFDGVGLGRTSVWLPFSTMPREAAAPGEKPWYDQYDRYVELVARLAPSASPAAVEAHATATYRRFLSEQKFDSGASILLGPLSEARAPGSHDRETLIVTRTSAVAALLLIIACANVSNLFLATAVARRREIGVRLALGVSRARLAASALLESIVLAALAGGASVFVAEWAGGLLRVQLMPRVAWSHRPVELRVLVFTVFAAFIAAVVSGALPVVLAWRASVGDAFRSGTPHATPGHRRARSALLATQATLSVMLVSGAALFGRTLQAARHTDLGYDRDRLVTTQVYFPDRGQRAQVAALMPGIADRVARMRGVDGVAITFGAPMNEWISNQLYRINADSAHPLDGGSDYVGVSPGYFAVAGTRLIEGRGFLPSDGAGAAPVMIVGETMARQIWPAGRAVGQCLRPVSPSHPCYTVIGVAADVHEFRIQENTSEWQYYFPLDQLPLHTLDRALVIRARDRQADAVAANVQALLRATFPTASTRATTIDQSLQRELTPWKLGFEVFGALALFALLVASVGVSGVVSFDVRQRTHEIGIRMALGAAGANVVRMIVRQSTVVVAIGVAIGVAGSVVVGWYLRSLLYGVTPSDPVSLIIASTLLLLVAVAAAVFPSWRAQRIDPAVVLRDE